MRTTKGTEIFVDDEDFDSLSKFSWCVSVGGYPVARIDGQVKTLHSMILPSQFGFHVDHRDENKLNNTRENLRYLPAGINMNRGKRQRARGYLHACGKWTAEIRIPGKGKRYLGLFATQDQAAEAYRKIAEEHGLLI